MKGLLVALCLAVAVLGAGPTGAIAAPPGPDAAQQKAVIDQIRAQLGSNLADAMAAQQQLQGMRRALPPGHPAAEDPRQGVPGQMGGPQSPGAAGTGQYL